MIYGSTCSGIEAASCAWAPLGWRAAFLSEIDPFARAVLKARWPGVPLHGDFTTIEASDYEPIDLLVGGTPCQSFSVAGLRGGLGDDRGNLALEFLRLAGRLRPPWLVWENVPGVLSSLSHPAPDPVPPPDPVDLGCDGQEVDVEDEYDSEELHALACFLAGLSELGYGFAYRILDAQFFGLAQRRKRLFVVGYLGDWRRAVAVLFEREGLSGNPPPSRVPGEIPADGLTGGSRKRGGYSANHGLPLTADPAHALRPPSKDSAWKGDGADNLIAGTLTGGGKTAASHGKRSGAGYRVDQLAPVAYGGNRQSGPIEIAPAVNGHGGPHRRGQFETEAFIMEVADPLTANEGSTYTHEGRGNFRVRNVVATPFAMRGRAGGNMPEVHDKVSALRSASGGSTRDLIAFSAKDHGQDASDELAPTLRAGGHDKSHANGGVPPAVAFKASHFTRDKDGAPSEVAPPLSADADKGDQDTLLSAGRSGVRRLTPTECERLQGFSDDYTLIEWRGAPAKDGPRYRTLGDSMAVPVMAWLGQGIQMVEDLCSRAEDAE